MHLTTTHRSRRSIRRRLLVSLACLSLGACTTSAIQNTASAAWAFHTSEESGGRMCVIYATPSARHPEGLRRGPATMFLTRNPGTQDALEFSVTFGFPVRTSGMVVHAGDLKFQMFGQNEAGWLVSVTDTGDLISAFRRERTVRVSATSRRGNATMDTYDMTGFSAALDRLETDCRR